MAARCTGWERVLYMFRGQCAHHQEVKLYHTASGIITPVSGRLVHRLRESPLHVSRTMCSSSGGQIVSYSIWYHHTYRWPSDAQIERESSTCFEHYVLIMRWSKLYYTASGIITLSKKVAFIQLLELCDVYLH